MADHGQSPILDHTPPTEALKEEIEERKQVDHSIVDIMEINGQISDGRLKFTTIFKVNVGLRESNPAAYTPKLISIGPYHNKSPKLRSMEKYKLFYLQRFLKRKEVIDVESCMRELEKLKDKALKCYDDIENLGHGHNIVGEFSKIMLLDGCFLVEFIRERCGIPPGEEEHYQPIIDNAWMIYQVLRDMVVLENQLPFFVLTMLYNVTKRPNEEIFLYMVRRTLLKVSPRETYIPKPVIDYLDAEQKFDHLLHVLHMVSCPPEMTNSRQRTDASKKKGFRNINIYLGESLQRWRKIPSATELYEAGVSFTKIGSVEEEEDYEDTTTLLDIKFENGSLGIPCFVVENTAETFLRNLIAYEQHSSNVKPYFSGYAHIMDQLIKSHKDVKLLQESGIIHSYLGDDKAVANIFNKLGDGVLVGRFYYQEECNKLNQHREKPSTKLMKYWRKWMASLIDNYFFTPWAGAATLGAIMLLVLTIIQTVLAFKGGKK